MSGLVTRLDPAADAHEYAGAFALDGRIIGARVARSARLFESLALGVGV